MSHHVTAVRANQMQFHLLQAASYSAFLAFLLRTPSLSSSLLLRGVAGAGAWCSSSEPARGEPKSRWQTQASIRAKGEP